MVDQMSPDQVRDKIEASEARGDTKFERILRQLDVSNERTSAAIDKLSTAITGENGLVHQVRELKSDNRFTRWTIGLTWAGTVLAALAALWTTQGNLISMAQANLAAHSAASEAPQVLKK
jgi:hypothetical protein